MSRFKLHTNVAHVHLNIQSHNLSPKVVFLFQNILILPEEDNDNNSVFRHGEDPFDFVGYSQANNALTIFCK